MNNGNDQIFYCFCMLSAANVQRSFVLNSEQKPVELTSFKMCSKYFLIFALFFSAVKSQDFEERNFLNQMIVRKNVKYYEKIASLTTTTTTTTTETPPGQVKSALDIERNFLNQMIVRENEKYYEKIASLTTTTTTTTETPHGQVKSAMDIFTSLGRVIL